MKYLTRRQLAEQSLANHDLITEAVKMAFAKARRIPGVTIFLSHSHRDHDLVLRVKEFLRGQGVEVFVDWLDNGMPEVTSGETATKIKSKIEENDKFIVLITENSKSSKWVPWELGFADKAKGLDKVLIIPISEDDKEFTGVEYLGIYFSLEWYNGRWVVWRSDPTRLLDLVKWLQD